MNYTQTDSPSEAIDYGRIFMILVIIIFALLIGGFLFFCLHIKVEPLQVQHEPQRLFIKPKGLKQTESFTTVIGVV